MIYASGAAPRLCARCGPSGLWLEALLHPRAHGSHARTALDAPGEDCGHTVAILTTAILATLYSYCAHTVLILYSYCTRKGPVDFVYLANESRTIPGVDDASDFIDLVQSMQVLI